MFRKLFGRKLQSNNPINPIHTPTSTVQQQQEVLRRLQQTAQRNSEVSGRTGDIDSFAENMLRKNQDLLNRR